jgi:hypothetical protein
MGVGVNTGETLIGNIGSKEKFGYDVLGDTVSTTARLEGQTKNYGVLLIIGPNTAELVRDEYAVTELDCIAVKGKQQGLKIYTVGCETEQHRQFLEFYYSGEWKKALILLEDLKNNNSMAATTEVEKKTNDSVIKNSVVTNALEELLNEKESKTKQEAKVNRWQLTSNVAPIFLGSISNGSAIDPVLDNNSKTYNTSVGFGLGVSYSATSKLSVRTGLNKVNMSYNTNDIMFFASIESRGLKNVSPTRSSAMMEIHSMVSSNNSVGSTSENGMLPFESALVQQNTGYLNQEIGYLEMPLEMTYALIDKKFGLKVIGGFSTLLLQENAITVVSDNNSMLLGEANNLNNIHFSTNLGIGIKYGFMKSFEFNVEPMVKYQLNTFSTNGGDFKPYFFGIYSGVSYKF